MRCLLCHHTRCEYLFVKKKQLMISGSFVRQIFFPRSIQGEIAVRDAARERKESRRGISTGLSVEFQVHTSTHCSDAHLVTSDSNKRDYCPKTEGGLNGDWPEEGPENQPPLRPNRRQDDIELEGQRVVVHTLSKHHLKAVNVNPMVTNYTSPIGLSFFSCLFCSLVWNWHLGRYRVL